VNFVTEKKEAPRIDISSLVDVVFLLIIFFAISTTFVSTSGVTVRPPASSTASAARGGLEVLVGQDGTVVFEGEEIPGEEIRERLPGLVSAAMAREATASRVVVRGDEGVEYGVLYRVLDAVREAGVEAFVLAARPASDE
jgi:biopolymer transport protein ExbD